MAVVGGAVLLHMGGCSVQVRGKGRPLVRMERIKGQLELSMEQNTDESASSGTSREITNTVFEEELLLQTQGDVYHSNLMTYLAMIGLGWKQQSFDNGEETDNSSGNFTRYRLNMNFLPLKPYPFSLNFGRTDTLVPRRFRDPLRVEDSSMGASIRLRIPDWPMTLSFSSSETKQKSNLSDDDDLFARSSDRWSYSLQHDFSERSHLDFRSDWENISQESGGVSLDTTTGRHRLDHDFRFGSSRQHRLDSSLSLLDRSGLFDSQTLNWNEALILKHSPSFTTFYSTFFSTSTFDTATSETISGTTGFTHRLYRNLLTSFSVFASKTEFGSDSNSEFLGGDLKFDYVRSNPLGNLLSEYSIRMTNEKASGGAGSAFVIDESHTADILSAFTLNERNIDTSTLLSGCLIYKMP